MQLVVTFEDPGRGRRRAVVLHGRIVFGRLGGSDRVVLDSPEIAEPHAEIVSGEDGAVRVRALSPEAALFHNGRLVEAAPLSPGDTLHFGATAARIVHERDHAWAEVVPRDVLRPSRRRSRESRIVGRATGVAVAAGFLALIVAASRPAAYSKGRPGGTLPETRLVVAEPSMPFPAAASGSAARAWPHASARQPDFSEALLSVVGLSRVAAGWPPSLGAGFIATPEGLVVTSARVVAGASELEAVFRDGSRLRARVAARDWSRDLALVRLPAGEAYAALAVARTPDLSVGTPVWAIGFHGAGTPGLGITRGVLSGLRRVPGLPVLVLHDAPVHSGGSGGPLLDESSRVVGIDSREVATGDRIGVAVAGDEILALLGTYR